ncbi:hypothetical protein DP44_875 [Burkholderia pseudomallei]|nr:hypothetical protein DP44_875 [Burkholderia pseudomallei]
MAAPDVSACEALASEAPALEPSAAASGFGVFGVFGAIGAIGAIARGCQCSANVGAGAAVRAARCGRSHAATRATISASHRIMKSWPPGYRCRLASGADEMRAQSPASRQSNAGSSCAP